MNDLALARLPSGFSGSELTNNVYSNCKLINSKLAELYALDDSIFYEGVITQDDVPALDTKLLNRKAYRWLNAQFVNLAIVVNQLVARWNKHGIVGKPDFTDTAMIDLWLPQVLALDDDFKNKINSNWQIIEDKLNDCLLYFNELYEKEG